MEIIFLIVLMSILVRAAGGGIVRLPSPFNRAPELAFAAVFGLVAVLQHSALAGLLAWVWCYLWMETGHGTAFAMGKNPAVAQSGRKQFLSPPVDWVCAKFNKPLGGTFYCWLFMGLKGALIGLPCFPYGLALALLWPASYALGQALRPGSLFGEFFSGASAGLVVGLTIFGLP